MPRFGDAALTDDQLQSLVRYVVYLRNPNDRGGNPSGTSGRSSKARSQCSSASARWCSRFAGSGPDMSDPSPRVEQDGRTPRVLVLRRRDAGRTRTRGRLCRGWSTAGRRDAAGNRAPRVRRGPDPLGATRVMPKGPFVEERHPLATTPEEREARGRARARRNADPPAPVARRHDGALVALGVAFLFPIRSLGPSPADARADTMAQRATRDHRRRPARARRPRTTRRSRHDLPGGPSRFRRRPGRAHAASTPTRWTSPRAVRRGRPTD